MKTLIVLRCIRLLIVMSNILKQRSSAQLGNWIWQDRWWCESKILEEL